VDLTSGTLFPPPKKSNTILRASMRIVLKAFSDVEEKQKYIEGHNPICDLLRESPLKHPTGFLTPWEDRSNFLCERCLFLSRKMVELSYLVEGYCSLDRTLASCSSTNSTTQTYHCFIHLLLLNIYLKIVRFYFLLLYLIIKGREG